MNATRPHTYFDGQSAEKARQNKAPNLFCRTVTVKGQVQKHER